MGSEIMVDRFSGAWAEHQANIWSHTAAESDNGAILLILAGVKSAKLESFGDEMQDVL